MRPLPPILTLFPYTTLFRSRRIAGVPADHGRFAVGQERWGRRVAAVAQRRHRVVAEEFGQAGALQGEALDRKSTRLNSSHLVISYAVFCLKKKSTAINSCLF